MQKWNVQESDHGCRQRSVAYANPLPVEGKSTTGQQFTAIASPSPTAAAVRHPAHERSGGHHQHKRANNVNVTASRRLNGQQRVPGVGQNQVRSLPGTTQDIERTRTIANSQTTNATFSAKATPESRRPAPEKKAALLRDMGWVDRMFMLRVSGYAALERQDRWNDNIGVVAEPLQAAIPNIAMDIIHPRPGAAEEIPCATRQPGPAQ